MIRAAALALVALGLPAPALAEAAQLVVVGCDQPSPEAVATALALEAPSDWTIGVAPADVVLELALDGCDDLRWTLRIVEASGSVRRGPIELDVEPFPPASRPRVVALVLAEWLATWERPPEPEPVAAVVEPVVASAPAPATIVVPPPPPPLGETANALAPPRTPFPVLVRFVALASFRHLPDMPASFGGADLGLEVLGRGSLTLGAQAGIGAEGGLHWDFPAVVVRGHLAALGILFSEDALELAIGVRGTLHYVALYERGWTNEEVHGALHGALGGVVRAATTVAPGVRLALDLELGAALADVHYVYRDAFRTPPPDAEDTAIFGGFSFALRAGVLIE